MKEFDYELDYKALDFTREQIAPGVTDHAHLVQKLKDYRLRLT